MKGTLYLLGVGPGDPELMTLKCARILQEVGCVAFPQKPETKSFALKIVASYLAKNTELMPIELPMKMARQPAKNAYDRAEIAISERLNSGKSVAYLCEGDPFFYGSAMYLFSRLFEKFDVQIVPGVTSINAASAALGRPLVARSERLKVLPATLDDDTLRDELSRCEAAALMKVGRHFPRIRTILEKTGHGQNAWIVENASGQNQTIMPLAECVSEALPYFSIILCYKGNEDWAGADWVKKEKQK